MKLLELKLWGYKNLEDITINFCKSKGCTLIVGTNGSGKSNLLEALSAIFSALYNHEKNVHPDFRFELDYAVNESCFVKVRNVDGVIDLLYCESADKDDTDYQTVDVRDFDKYLPEHLIAVYSGEEQRLWENYYFSAYDAYNKQYMEGKAGFHTQQMIYLNHYYWDLIASILSIHEIDEYRDFVSSKIGIKVISSIHLAFDVSKLKRNRNKAAKQILEIVNPELKEEVEVSLETLTKVKEFCGYEPEMFYNMVVLRLYKDFKIITDLTIRCANGIEIKDLSEGEKKLLLIYGAINLLSGNNLYLLDEPDAHLHEGRKKEIFDLIRQDEKSQFIITSHSPTLTKMFRPNEVVLLDKADGSCKIQYGEVSNAISKLTDGEWNYIDQSIFFDANRPLLIVEGSGDAKYISKAIELLTDNNSEYAHLKNMDILHAGGAANVKGFIDELSSFIPSGKKVIVLFDRDQAGGEGMKANIGKGASKDDKKTYLKNGYYFLKLPKLPGLSGADFVIEDYFPVSLKKSLAQATLDNALGDFNGFPSNVKESVKSGLARDLEMYDEKTMSGFGTLLDKLCDIINDKEPVVEV